MPKCQKQEITQVDNYMTKEEESLNRNSGKENTKKNAIIIS